MMALCSSFSFDQGFKPLPLILMCHLILLRSALLVCNYDIACSLLVEHNNCDFERFRK